MAEITQWTNCYDEGWQGIIVPEAFSHPAKMSYGLLKHILAHVKEQGWTKEGDIIVDPFGGIGSTGILGAYESYQVVCCELEQKFVDLAEQNFEMHKDAWVEFGNPFPIIIQGDSRRLCEVVEKADLILSSPPYSEQPKPSRTDHGILNHKENCKCNFCVKNRGNKGMVQGYRQADCIVSSPPYSEIRIGQDSKQEQIGHNEAYSKSTPGQLGAMKPGKVDMILSSPPYAETLKGDGTQKETAAESRAKRRTPSGSLGQSQRTQGYGSKGNLGNLKSGDVDAIISSPPYGDNPKAPPLPPDRVRDTSDPTKHGAAGPQYISPETPENLGNLKSGDVDCVISSPPWENQEGSMQSKKFKAGSAKMLSDRNAEGKTKGHYATPAARKRQMDKANQQSYGDSEGQLGQEQGDTFWQAAKIIVKQCHQILKPSGHAIWVVKSFVRNKAIVDFPGDWQRLCEAVGFKTVCIHHAMLVKETKEQSLFGDTVITKKERKSFFRRLAEKKGSPPIDFECVLCMRKENQCKK